MKLFSITTLLFLASLSLKAQVVRIDTVKNQSILLKTKNYHDNIYDYIYTIGLRVFKIEQFPKLLNQQDEEFKNLYATGLIFKINDNQINYRISGTYFYGSKSINNNCSDCDIVSGHLSDFTAKVGFEKLITYTTVQPYFGFDLGYRKNRFKGSGENATETFAYTPPYEAIQEKNGLILAPVLGININLVRRISLSAEASLDMMYDYERQSRTYRDASRTRTVNHYRNWEFLLTPVVLTLQYSFGDSD